MATDLRKKVAIIGAAETDTVGAIPDITQLGLHAQAALNALNDAGLDKNEIDGLACAGESVVAVAERLGHEDASLVLSTYGHLMPGSDDRTRSAIDSAWGTARASCAPDVPQAARAVH